MHVYVYTYYFLALAPAASVGHRPNNYKLSCPDYVRRYILKCLNTTHLVYP